jgi:hypothetical protein
MQRRGTAVLELGFWVMIVTLAFIMQGIPFLLVLTLFNIAIGVSSATALVIIPIAVFGMLFLACWFATQQTRRRWVPRPPLPIDQRGQQAGRQWVSPCLLPFLKRQRYYW